jgi:hypothetical protein
VQINSGFLLQHFIRHLRTFKDLYISKEDYHKGYWHITLSDGERYSLSDQYWKQTIKLVPRFNNLRKMLH